MTDDRSDHERGGWLWKIERIEERQKDILSKLDRITAMLELIIQRADERGWKIDSVLAEQTRVAREMLETMNRQSKSGSFEVVRILVVGLVALALGNFGARILQAFVGG